MPLQGLRKMPKTVLIINTYSEVTEKDRRAIREITRGAGMEIHYSEKATHYSLVILCGLVFRFSLTNPLAVAEGEIWFTRAGFSKKVFLDALNHYSNCEMRDGR
jgi:hypothetical protein